MEQLHKQVSEQEGSREVRRARDLTQPVRGSLHWTTSGDERERRKQGADQERARFNSGQLQPVPPRSDH